MATRGLHKMRTKNRYRITFLLMNTGFYCNILQRFSIIVLSIEFEPKFTKICKIACFTLFNYLKTNQIYLLHIAAQMWYWTKVTKIWLKLNVAHLSFVLVFSKKKICAAIFHSDPHQFPSQPFRAVYRPAPVTPRHKLPGILLKLSSFVFVNS